MHKFLWAHLINEKSMEESQEKPVTWGETWREGLQSRRRSNINIAAEFRVNQDMEVIHHRICQRNRHLSGIWYTKINQRLMWDEVREPQEHRHWGVTERFYSGDDMVHHLGCCMEDDSRRWNRASKQVRTLS